MEMEVWGAVMVVFADSDVFSGIIWNLSIRSEMLVRHPAERLCSLDGLSCCQTVTMLMVKWVIAVDAASFCDLVVGPFMRMFLIEQEQKKKEVMVKEQESAVCFWWMADDANKDWDSAVRKAE